MNSNKMQVGDSRYVAAITLLLSTSLLQANAQTIPQISSISPTAATYETQITITGNGFDPQNNDIGFVNVKSKDDGSVHDTGYMTNIPSKDSKTLAFQLPESVGVCPSLIEPGTACPDIALLLDEGEYEVFVVNKNGKSNALMFKITSEPFMKKISIPTDNGSTNVEIIIENAKVEGNQLVVDQPQVVAFNLRFLDPVTSEPIGHVNYALHMVDETGNMVVHKTALHVHEGMDTQSVTFSNTGSFTLTVDVEGTGISQPYDTTNSGTASVMIAVTPEFSLDVMAIMAAVVGIAVAATRLKNPLKL